MKIPLQLARGASKLISGDTYSVIENSKDGELQIWNEVAGEPPKHWRRVKLGLASASQAERVKDRLERIRESENNCQSEE